MGGRTNRPIPPPPSWGLGSKSPRFRFHPTGLRSTKMSTGHIWEHLRWLWWSDSMNNRKVKILPKPLTSKCKSSTVCAVVERPDLRCGDDLVSLHLCTDLLCKACFPILQISYSSVDCLVLININSSPLASHQPQIYRVYFWRFQSSLGRRYCSIRGLFRSPCLSVCRVMYYG